MERKPFAKKRRSAAPGAAPQPRSRTETKKGRGRRPENKPRRKHAPSPHSRAARRSEAGTIVAGSIAVAAVLMIALGVLALFMPELRLSRAQSLVNSGQLDAADNLINVLESEGKPQARIDALRLSLAPIRRMVSAGSLFAWR